MVKDHHETMRYLISTVRILIINTRKYTPPTMRGSHGLVVTIRLFTTRYLMVTTWYLLVSLSLQEVHVTSLIQLPSNITQDTRYSLLL